MSYKSQFIKDKEWYIKNWDWVLNGNYGDIPEYRVNLEGYKSSQTMTPKRKAQTLKRIVINGFTKLVSLELGCSYGHAQKIITEAMGDELPNFTAQCISELPDGCYAD